MNGGGKSCGQSFPQRGVNQGPNYDRKPVRDKRPRPDPVRLKKKKAIRWI